MMMKAGVSFNDWRHMTYFQRMDFLARRTIEMDQIRKKMDDAEDNIGKIAGMVISKLMGFM